MNVQRKDPREPVPERNHDRSVENVLRRMLPDDVPAQPQNACPDAETFAAWHEGSLRAEAAAGMERHVADCTRCRALMAAFIQTTPFAPAVESRRRWHLGWAVPLATAATVAALWIAVPGNPPVPASPDRVASTVSVDASPPAASPVTPPTAASEPSALTSADALRKSGARAGNEEGKSATERESTRPDLSDEPADAAPTALIEADRRENTINSAPRPFASARQASPPVEIVAPGGSTRWRIVSGQQVEWSTPPTTQWGPAAIESSDVLTAGTAPSASVCWLVGRRGAVYVTTDGRRFTRVPFPEMADLVAVTATDDRNATVSAADGRSWATSDQGRTWTAQARN
jgi:hypothetical protein